MCTSCVCHLCDSYVCLLYVSVSCIYYVWQVNVKLYVCYVLQLNVFVVYVICLFHSVFVSSNYVDRWCVKNEVYFLLLSDITFTLIYICLCVL